MTVNDPSIDALPSRWIRKPEIKVVQELGRDIRPGGRDLEEGVASERQGPTLEMVNMNDVRNTTESTPGTREPVRSGADRESLGVQEAQRQDSGGES